MYCFVPESQFHLFQFLCNTEHLGRFHNWSILFSYSCPGSTKYQKTNKKSKSSKRSDPIFDYTSIDHLYVYKSNGEEHLYNNETFEMNVSDVLITSTISLKVIFLCCFFQILWNFTIIVLKKFHLLFLLIDVNSFSLPDINFIPGIHHFGNFLEIVAKGFKPLYVVSAEQKKTTKQRI